MPEIPDSWSQAIAAVGAILVIIMFLRWTAEILKGQGSQSATLIDRAFDIADKIVAGGMAAAERPDLPPILTEAETPQESPPETPLPG
jgi:hypothetical protein